MAAQKKVVLAAVVVLALVIIVAALRRFLRKDRYSVGNPAEPRQREASTDVLAAIDSIVETGAKFEQTVASLSTNEKSAYVALGGSTTLVVAKNITSVLARSRAVCPNETRCTGSGVLALYKGLCNTDDALMGVARRLTLAGRKMQQRADADQSIGDASDLSEAGMYLIRMGVQIRALNESVHVLGVSLDLE